MGHHQGSPCAIDMSPFVGVDFNIRPIIYIAAAVIMLTDVKLIHSPVERDADELIVCTAGSLPNESTYSGLSTLEIVLIALSLVATVAVVITVGVVIYLHRNGRLAAMVSNHDNAPLATSLLWCYSILD